MSNDEYTILEMKRFLATLFFKFMAEDDIPNEEAIRQADALIKELD